LGHQADCHAGAIASIVRALTMAPENALGGGLVALGADHGGYPLKETIKAHLERHGVAVVDVGTNSTEAVDYPVFARKVAELVAGGSARRGIVVDGAGIGSCMVANKVPGVRAGMAFDQATANNAREHNDANVLTLGAGYLKPDLALTIVDTFLTVECTVLRHKRRVAMIDALDEGRPRRSLKMVAAPDQKQQLIQQITRVLSDSPELLSTLDTGVVAGGCKTCQNCDNQCPTSAPDAVRSLVRGRPASRVSGRLGVRNVPEDLAKYIDHTLLRANATYAEIDQLCDEARQYGFASVCVNPVHVRRCQLALRGSDVKTCTVIGFPLGATPREVKALEARRALRDGAQELDMVINIGALKSRDLQGVYEDIRLVREVAHEGNALLKVIIETALLTDDEKVAACREAARARADFVKTSTGFSTKGATSEDVALMAQAVGHKLGVKASGGVRSAGDAQKMIAAGATRIGASVGIKIVREMRGEQQAGSASAGY
jgi:deoxyribose-phosphate aldolase